MKGTVIESLQTAKAWFERGSAALLAAAVLLVIQRGAASPFHPDSSLDGAARMQVTFSWMTQPVAPCREPTPQELADYRQDVAKSLALTGICPRERRKALLEVRIDGQPALTREYRPRGFRHDGPVTGMERLRIAPGRHTATVRLREIGASVAGERTETRTVPPRHVWTFDLAYPDPRWREWP